MELKQNKGVIFQNEKKSENAPDWKGQINVDGKIKDIALWAKVAQDGIKEYFSVSISEPYKP